MNLPYLTPTSLHEQVIDKFLGYDHEDRISEGAFYDTENLTSDWFPLMASRDRDTFITAHPGRKALLGKEKLAYVAEDRLYYNFEDTGVQLMPQDRERQLVGMGAYIVIFPDGYYYNTVKPEDRGYINALYQADAVHLSLCTGDGADIVYSESATAPEGAEVGSYWLDTSGETHLLKFLSNDGWTDVVSTFVKLTAWYDGPDFSMFEEHDGIEITHIGAEDWQDAYTAKDLKGFNVVHSISEDKKSIVITGLIDRACNVSIEIQRKAPVMDYVCECNNRLWGCRYGGVAGGEILNEIYCCALGDFKNWRRYEGLATDSYTASCGSDGPWTGCINYLGNPIFFKENRMHKVYVSGSGAHQIQDMECRGVETGSWKSLAIVDNKLYYKAVDGICVYDGSLPRIISTALGRERFATAVGCGFRTTYYVAMSRPADFSQTLFLYDTSCGMWLRVCRMNADSMAVCDNTLYIAERGGRLRAIGADGSMMSGEYEEIEEYSEDIRREKEAPIHWLAETGIIGYAETGRKSVSRFNIKMKLPAGSNMNIWIQYDSDGLWRPCGTIAGSGLKTFLLPVRPVRCDHFKLRLEGTGDVLIYSFSKVYEGGTDAG